MKNQQYNLQLMQVLRHRDEKKFTIVNFTNQQQMSPWSVRDNSTAEFDAEWKIKQRSQHAVSLWSVSGRGCGSKLHYTTARLT
jgi:hypothetical protein